MTASGGRMRAEVRFFHCGNGDTILVRGGDEWALIDANLTRTSKAAERVEATIREQRIEKLRFVCITHFDADHFRGLGAFLRKHFGPKDGVRKGWAIEQILLPVHIGAIWELFSEGIKRCVDVVPPKNKTTAALAELLETLKEIWDTNPAIFQSYAPGTKLASPDLDPASASLGPWDVNFLGPSEEVMLLYTYDFRVAWGLASWLPHQRPKPFRTTFDKNDSSRILALCHRETHDIVLLTGDATSEMIRNALLQWENVVNDRADLRDRHFRLVKVSHHGAWTERVADNCHHEELYAQRCSAEHSYVVISCRSGDVLHPHEKTLKCLREKKLRSLSTGVPGVELRNEGPLNGVAFAGTPHVEPDDTPQDVRIEFTPGECVLVGGNRCAVHDQAN